MLILTWIIKRIIFYNYLNKSAFIFDFFSVNGHTDIATVVRNSAYFQNIPPLAVECTDMDGDTYSTPLIFEDVYCEVWQAARQCKLVHLHGL